MNNIRMCILCRKKLPKVELIRFVLNKHTGKIKINNSPPAGRGYYLCWDDDHQNTLTKPYILNRVFKIQISPEAISPLLEYLQQNQHYHVKI